MAKDVQHAEIDNQIDRIETRQVLAFLSIVDHFSQQKHKNCNMLQLLSTHLKEKYIYPVVTLVKCLQSS